VNAVVPTFVETEMTADLLQDSELRRYVFEQIPLGRMARAHEVAAAVCFLASGHASMITGVILPIDGGWTCQ
jgi:NAD(P)-dependent dehydrogenase (short-subunit alcohol dehydrogenase family)